MNIRGLPTTELKTYDSAYKKGQVYKFARDEARAELKRRSKTKIKRVSAPCKRKTHKRRSSSWTEIDFSF